MKSFLIVSVAFLAVALGGCGDLSGLEDLNDNSFTWKADPEVQPDAWDVPAE